MSKAPAKIRFSTKLLRPSSPKTASWSFLVLPESASAKLPTRNMATVDGSLNGHPFQATLAPDGQGSHWLKIEKALREAAGVEVGETVRLEIAPADQEAEIPLPDDLKKALAAEPAAQALWREITTVARRDWIQWVTSAKKAETRERRVAGACDMLASGKRRVCCFDRSGKYSNAMCAPEPMEE
ncbi:YdeI/OmpD-associated family protein [Luteimonas aquatica]|uniref:YdeI/OmpD-associated family protein n=1 Tax=Luteimonas aquatica TaxID=450364 RepID=UPI001F5928EE|nr:YdeI/OmpD-associated family protein [Luteimonas aquatica]